MRATLVSLTALLLTASTALAQTTAQPPSPAPDAATGGIGDYYSHRKGSLQITRLEHSRCEQISGRGAARSRSWTPGIPVSTRTSQIC